VDGIIEAWAEANALELQRSWADRDARFTYLSSPQGECFQIALDPPDNENVKVHIWSIETLDDMEAHLEWFVPTSQLRVTLDIAHKTVRECLWRREPAYRLW